MTAQANKPKGKRGGARPGAGRKPGSGNTRAKLTQQAVAIALRGDPSQTPLAVILSTMRALWAKATANKDELDLKYALPAAELAKDAAPFVHPKLSNIDMKQSGSVTVKKVVYQVTPDGRVIGEVPAGQARVEEHTQEEPKPALAKPDDPPA